MTEEFFYHYTTKEAATGIFLSGKILPSLGSKGDAAHGDGVYLTTLEPRLGIDTVKNNNWAGLAGNGDKKVEAYYEIFLPSSKVIRAKDKRDIQVHSGALNLSDYKWSLKNWEGELLATEHFMISSQGEAAIIQHQAMGRYTLARNIVMYDGIPVYKHDEAEYYLFRNKTGNWVVSIIAGHNHYNLSQNNGDFSPSPLKTLPWRYSAPVWKEDVTLRVYPCY